MVDIIYFSSIPWDYFHHRQQEMMEWFARNGYRVFFWEPNGWLDGLYECRELHEGLYAVRSFGFKYERCLRGINSVNSHAQSLAYQRLIRDFRIDHPVIWFDRIHGVDLDGMLAEHRCVYDLIDEITAFGRWNNARLLLSLERRVVAECNLVISSSQTLMERKATGLCRRSIFIPNGCDSNLIQKDIKRPKSGRRPVVGFCGMISRRRLNTELIEATARLLPNFVFEFIGPRDSSAADLVFKTDNVIIKGPVHPDALAEVLSTFDVGFIPYRLEGIGMDYVFPKKAFEYMAAGLPVVSTSLPECVRFERGVLCADTAAEVASALQRAFAMSFREREKQREVAKMNTWDVLLPPLKRHIDELVRGDA